MVWTNGPSKHIRQSETARFITRYVPEFLKHFRGSLIKATRSNTLEATPRIQIIIIGTPLYVNSLLTVVVILFSAVVTIEIPSELGLGERIFKSLYV